MEVIVYLLFIAGVSLMGIGLIVPLIMLLRRRQLSAYAIGTLTSASVGPDGRVHLTVTFTAGNETLTLTENRRASKAFMNRIGSDVDIRYNPDDAQDFYVVQNKSHLTVSAKIIGLGLIMAVAAEYLGLEYFFVDLPFIRQFHRLLWIVRHRLRW